MDYKPALFQWMDNNEPTIMCVALVLFFVMGMCVVIFDDRIYP